MIYLNSDTLMSEFICYADVTKRNADTGNREVSI